MQTLAGVSAIDGIGRERHRIADAIGVAGRHQGSSGIQQDDIAARRALAIKDRADDGGILLRITAGNVFQRSALQSKLLRRDLVNAHLSVAHLGNFAGTGDGDLIQTIAPVDHERAARTPSWLSASASFSTRSAEYTPTTCADAFAGLVSGPSRLKTVRSRRSRRAVCTYFIAECIAGA